MKKIFKDIKKIPFFICLSFSITLIIVSFIIKKKKKIDPSVLQAVGEIFLFATLYVVIEGINKGSNVDISKGDVSIHIQNPENENEEIDG